MAEVKIIISADGSSVKPATEGVAKAFTDLKVKTVAEITQQKTEINKAYEAIRQSGTVSAAEIKQAWAAKNLRIAELDKELLAKQGGIVAGIKQHWLALSASIAGIWITAQKAWHLAEMSAQFEEQKAALNSLAGQYNATASQIITSVQEASRGLISMADAASVSAKAIMMGMNPQQLVEFMRIVEATTNVTGMKVAQSFETIAEAASVGRERTLKQMGIMIDLTDAYKKYASQTGRTTEQLSEFERQQAGINAILAKGTSIMQQIGDQGDSTNDKMESLSVTVEDLKLHLGTGLIRAGAGVIGIFQELASFSLMVAAGILKIAQAIGWLGSKTGVTEGIRNEMKAFADEMKLDADAAWEASKDLAVKGIDNFKTMVAKSEDLAKAGRKPLNIGIGTTGGTDALDEIKKLSEQIRSEIDKMNLTPVQQIEKQAAEWIAKAKGNAQLLIEIEKWKNLKLEELNIEHLLQITADNEEAAERKRKSDMEDLQFNLEMTQRKTENELAEKLDSITQQEDMYKDLHDNFLISDQQYFEQLQKITKEETDIRLKALDEQHKAFVDERNAERLADGTTLDEKKKILQELKKEDQDYWAKRAGIARKGAAQQTQIERDAAKNQKKIFGEMRDAFSNIFYDAITGKLKNLGDYFSSVLQSMLRYFTDILGQMAIQALAQPIIIPIGNLIGSSYGAFTPGAVSSSYARGIGAMTPTTAAPGTFMPYGAMSYLGAAGGLYGMYQAYQSRNPLMGALSGAAAGTAIYPGIGTAIGAIVGGIVGFLGKKKSKDPSMQIAYGAEGEDIKYGGGHMVGNWWIGAGGKDSNFPIEAQDQITKAFDKLRTSLKDAMTGLGADITKFDAIWKGSRETINSQEDMQKALDKWIGDYSKFVTGLDFSKFQKAGEKISATVARIFDAIGAVPDMKNIIDDYIAAINNSYDEIAKWRDGMSQATEKIKEFSKSINDMTDPADQISALNELRQAYYSRYVEEKQLIEGLQNSIHQAKIEYEDFSYSLTKKINDLQGDPNKIALSTTAMDIVKKKIEDANTEAEKLGYIKDYISQVDNWVSANTQAIKKWQGILDDTGKQITSLEYSSANPQIAEVRMQDMQAELYQRESQYKRAGTEEDKQKYAVELKDFLGQYISLAQEAYQRPSGEYARAYNETISGLRMIQNDAEKYTAKGQIDIASLDKKMADELSSLNVSATQYYQWAMGAGAEAYRKNIEDLQNKLQIVTGDKPVGIYLEDLKQITITELEGVKTRLDGILAAFTTSLSPKEAIEKEVRAIAIPLFMPNFLKNIPQLAEGGYVTRPTIALIGEAGPEYIVPEKKTSTPGKTVQYISISPNITVNAKKEVDENQIARKLMDLTEASIVGGKLKQRILDLRPKK